SAERSLSQHDVEHRFVATGDWQMPFGHGRRFGSSLNRLADAVLGGWEVSAFFLLQSGYPLQVNQSGGTLWNGTQRPNLVGDPATSGDIHDRLNNYFNQAAFSRPAPDTFGTAPRTLDIRGPAVNILDAALIKNWRGQGGERLQVRLQAQELRSRPGVSGPAADATSQGATTFGAGN